MNSIVDVMQQVQAGVVVAVEAAVRAASTHSDDFVLVGP